VNYRIGFNPEDIEKLSRGFAEAVRAESVRTLEFLSNAAIRQLRKFDHQLGHDMLAELWDHTAPIETDDAVYMEVYNRAEYMTFYDKTSSAAEGRHRSSKYPISGEALLSILEGGAKSHPISPRDPKGVLTIPNGGTEARATAHIREHGPGSFLPAEDGDTDFVRQVEHPGVEGNFNVRTTRTMIELGLESEAEAAAARIALRLV
jgi:hypothetical protein